MQITRWRLLLLDVCAIAAPASALNHLTAWLPASCKTPTEGPEKAAFLMQEIGSGILGQSQSLAAIVVLVWVASYARRPCARLARRALVARMSVTLSIAAYLAAAYFAVEVIGRQVDSVPRTPRGTTWLQPEADGGSSPFQQMNPVPVPSRFRDSP